jgi:cytochrome c5
MKRRSNVYTILIVFVLLIQQIISGCATTVTTDVQKKELIREELPKEAAGPDGQKLYEGKCSPCHVLPDIGAYGYTPEQWVKTIDGMHNPADYSAFITEEEDAKIKDYLKNKSQK